MSFDPSSSPERKRRSNWLTSLTGSNLHDRPPRIKKTTVADHPIPPRVHLVQWEGLETGDIVKLTGRQGEFIFRSAVLCRDSNEVDHIELIERKDPKFVAVTVDRVKIPTGPQLKRQRRDRELAKETG